MTTTTAPAAHSPAVAAELRVLAANPGAYPTWRLARVLDGRTAGVPSSAACRRAAELRAEVLGL